MTETRTNRQSFYVVVFSLDHAGRQWVALCNLTFGERRTDAYIHGVSVSTAFKRITKEYCLGVL